MEDNEIKTEIQNLRTELNKLKKCLSGIRYDIEHLKKDEASESLLSEINYRIYQLNL